MHWAFANPAAACVPGTLPCHPHPSAVLQVGGGAVVRCIYAAHAPATVQLRRDPACASAWLLACADLLLAHHTASLDALLAALGVAPTQLSRVLLQQCVVVPSGVPAAPLPGVTRLILQQLGAGAARDLAPRLPQLAVANLLEMGLEGADALAPLAGLATLHTLQCDGCDLRELPEGRYLAGGRKLAARAGWAPAELHPAAAEQDPSGALTALPALIALQG